MKSRISFLLLLMLLLVSCKDQAVFQRNQGYIFNTGYRISYTAKKDLHSDIKGLLEQFDATFSMFNPESTLSSINKAGTDSIDLTGHPWLLTLLGEALHISAISEGAFDITVAPLVDAWGFGTLQRKLPEVEDLDSLMAFVGYTKLSLNGNKLSKQDARMRLDASAIAKGYACDLIAEHLEETGVKDYLIEIGGEIRMGGHNPKGEIWKVGIDKPIDDSSQVQRELQAALALTGKGLATSGNYRNYYQHEGQKLAHTIDPRLGKPIQQNVLSATVVASQALTADAYATAFMILGLNKSVELVESLPDLEAYFIYVDEEGNILTWVSEGLQSALKTF